jgi:DNA-binding MarR family transcriptional regulator
LGRPRAQSLYDEKLGNVARVLLTLLKHERQGRKLSISELQAASRVAKSVYHGHLYNFLKEAGLIEEEKGQDRTYVKLTRKGREFAKCLEKVADVLGLKNLVETTSESQENIRGDQA